MITSTADESPARRSDRTFVLVSLLAFVTLVLFTIFHHEPWRDEGDVWLAARDMNLAQLFRWSHYTGTPLLWYVIVMALAKSGLPYITEHLLHAAIATINAALVLIFAPFSRIVRLALVFSFLMCFDFAVVARNYVLIVFCVLMLSILYRQRFQRPILLAALLAIMCNASIHGIALSAGFCTALLAEAIYRHKLNAGVLAAGAIVLVSVVVSVSQVLPSPPDRQYLNRERKTGFTPLNIEAAIVRSAFPFAPVDFARIGQVSAAKRIAALTLLNALRLLALGVAAALIYSIRKFPLALLGLGVMLLMLLSIFGWVYYAGDRHAGMMWLAFLASAWIVRRELPAATQLVVPLWCRCLIGLSLLESCGVAALFHTLDWRYEYSDSTPTARFLASALRPDDVVGCVPDNMGASILPYLPGRKFYYVGRGGFGTYGLWDENFSSSFYLTREQYMARLDRALPGDDRRVIILNEELPDPGLYHLELLHRSGRVFRQSDERYFVYRGLGSPAMINSQ